MKLLVAPTVAAAQAETPPPAPTSPAESPVNPGPQTGDAQTIDAQAGDPEASDRETTPAPAEANGAPGAPGAPSEAPVTMPAEPPGEDSALGFDEAALAAELNAALTEQVVSGASRTAETAEQAPVAAVVVRAEDLRRYNIRTVAEAVRFISMGAFTIGGQGSGNELLGARGIAGSHNHFLVLIDGQPANQPLTGGVVTGYGLGLPISMIDSIEVILGPGSVVYGSNAMLGVLSVRTKPARQMSNLRLLGEYGISPAQDASGGIRNFDRSGLGQSKRVEATYGTAFRLFDRDSEVTLGVLLAKRELPDAPIAPQTPFPNAPPTARRFGGTLSDQVLDSGYGGYGRVRIGKFSVDAAYMEGRWPFTSVAPQILDPSVTYFPYRISRLNLVQNVEVGSHFTGFAALRGVHYDHGPHRHANACPPGGTTGSLCTNEVPGRAFSQQLELQGAYDLFADGRYQIMLGLDGRLRQAASNSIVYDDATGGRFETGGAYKSRGQAFGAYTQFRGRVLPWMALNLGIRADWIRDEGELTPLPAVNPVTYRSAPTVTNHAFSPRAAAMFFPTDTTTLYGGYSRAFRAPTPNENFLISSTIEPAGKLSPETVDSGEIGIKQKFGVHRLTASGFASRWKGLIGSRPSAPGLSRYGNLGDIHNYGANLSVEGAFLANRLHYGLSGTYGYARQEEDADAAGLPPNVQQAILQSEKNSRFIGAPELAANARIAYDFQGNAPEVALALVVYGPRLTSFAYSNRLQLPSATGGAPIPLTVAGHSWRSNLDPEFTDTMAELRVNISGNVPKLPALRYYVFGNYLFSEAFEASAFGPTPGGSIPTFGIAGGTVESPRATGQRFPSTKLTLGLGLQVSFDP